MRTGVTKYNMKEPRKSEIKIVWLWLLLLASLLQAKQSLATLTKDVPKRHSLSMPTEAVVNGNNQEWVMQADLPLTAAIRQSQQTLYVHTGHPTDRQGRPRGARAWTLCGCFHHCLRPRMLMWSWALTIRSAWLHRWSKMALPCMCFLQPSVMFMLPLVAPTNRDIDVSAWLTRVHRVTFSLL